VDIEGVRRISNWIVNKNILLQAEIFRNIRAAFTTTVYAFLNPGRPSAAWDFFCLTFTPVGAGLLANRTTRCVRQAAIAGKSDRRTAAPTGDLR
jgi:hypothetical protein